MSTTTTTGKRAAASRKTLEDLYRVEGKAELIGGEIVHFMASGRKPNRVAARIFRSLDDYAEANRQGEAYTDSMGFAVPMLASGRQSFSPDASYYLGPFGPNDMRFVEGPPTLAVEVRSESDYGPTAERAIVDKRGDYFEAGTLVVWDVDPVAEIVAVYKADAPERTTVFRRGETADAEPAAPGWRMKVEEMFSS